MRNERGFSLIEILVALLILAVVITTTIAMFTERQKRIRQANETMLAYQVLSNEVEYWRRMPLSVIDDEKEQKFQTDTALIKGLEPVVTAVKVDKPKDDVREVTFTIRWENGKREARLAVVRTNTGANNLW